MKPVLQNIPTNVITGFLGVGKTTAIRQLLVSKPEHETWAVLVNEFGKIGIDGELLKSTGVVIKEIPGGCMCCSGISVQVGLNELLAQARPDRLLIEPTGAGHPGEIIKQFSRPPFDQVLDMRACICLVDPRHLGDQRYVENEFYREQLNAADILVANKTDQASEVDRAAFEQLLSDYEPIASGWVEHGQLEPEWLSLPRKTAAPKSHISLGLADPVSEGLDEVVLKDGEDFRRLQHEHKGIYSCGWLFAAEARFDPQQLLTAMRSVDAERIKATLRTEHGACQINVTRSESMIDDMEGEPENRIEVITLKDQDWDSLEQAILKTIV
ncbi:MAG: GTP-binding protein [Gammaproteobacteria bacterium]|nr:GTP-binding protein [Gammaproteobacteria bacterium]